MAILTTAILMMIGIFLSAVQTSRESRELSSGTLLAKSVLSEEVHKIATGASTITVTELFQADPLTITGQRKLGNQVFDFQITRDLVLDRVTGDALGDRLTENRLIKLQAIVTWTDNSDQSSPGQGLQRVGYSELVNQRDLP